jgi:hypothetical protein
MLMKTKGRLGFVERLGWLPGRLRFGLRARGSTSGFMGVVDRFIE